MSTEDVGRPPAPDSDDWPGDPLPNTDPQPLTDEDGKQSDAWIRYSIEWRDRNDQFKSRRVVSADNADDVEHNSDQSTEMPAFERVAVFRVTHQAGTGDGEREATDATQSQTGTTPEYHLRIYSVGIIHALRSVVRYYPQQDLSGDVIAVHWPYPILVHHYDELQRFQETSAKNPPSKACVRERHLDEHLDLLLRFLDREVMEQVNAEKERNKRGYSTFDYLWVSYRPGTTYLYLASGELEWRGAVIHSVEEGIFSQPRQPWFVHHWTMEHNGSWLDRKKSSIIYDKFDGEQSFSERYIMILGYGRLDEDQLQSDIVRQNVASGKAYWDLVSKQCRYHDGMTIGSPQREVRAV